MSQFMTGGSAVTAAEPQHHLPAGPPAAVHGAPCHPGERLQPAWGGGLECPACGIPWQLTAVVRGALVPPRHLAEACWDLPAEPAAAGRARALARGALAGWGLAAVDDVVLGVSELVANAALYGAEPLELIVRAEFRSDGATVTCEVSDGSALTPGFLAAGTGTDACSESGRGLRIVAALASAMGVRPATGGKAVWFSAAVPAVSGPAGADHRIRAGAAA